MKGRIDWEEEESVLIVSLSRGILKDELRGVRVKCQVCEGCGQPPRTGSTTAEETRTLHDLLSCSPSLCMGMSEGVEGGWGSTNGPGLLYSVFSVYPKNVHHHHTYLFLCKCLHDTLCASLCTQITGVIENWIVAIIKYQLPWKAQVWPDAVEV